MQYWIWCEPRPAIPTLADSSVLRGDADAEPGMFSLPVNLLKKSGCIMLGVWDFAVNPKLLLVFSAVLFWLSPSCRRLFFCFLALFSFDLLRWWNSESSDLSSAWFEILIFLVFLLCLGWWCAWPGLWVRPVPRSLLCVVLWALSILFFLFAGVAALCNYLFY